MGFFLHLMLTFPTVIYTGLILLAVACWVAVAVGAGDAETIHGDGPDDASSGSAPARLGSWLRKQLVRLGLGGVPVVVVLSFLALFGWSICFFFMYLLDGHLDSSLTRSIVGTVVFCGATVTAVFFTNRIIAPIRTFYSTANRPLAVEVLGRRVVVRSDKLDSEHGEVFLDDGGAGLLLKARTEIGVSFTRGDEVVLIRKSEDGTYYIAVAVAEFESIVD